MKKLTDTQKKWALTATMIAALGCSVSFNPYKPVSTSDFASTEEVDALTTTLAIDDKVLDLQLVSTGEHETRVSMSPSKDAEGKAKFECPSCEGSLVVDKKLRRDADTLRAIKAEVVEKMIARTKAADEKEEKFVDEETPSRRRGRDRDDEESSSRRQARSERRERTLSKKQQEELLYRDGDKACLDSKGNDLHDGVKQDKCFADAFVQTLKKEKINPSIAIKYYRKELEKNLISGLTEDEETEIEYNDAFGVIEDMLKDLPASQKSLHEQLFYASSKAIEKRANEYKRNSTSLDAVSRYNDLANYVNDLNQQSRLALSGSRLSDADISTIESNAATQLQQYVITIPAPGFQSAIQYQFQAPNSFGIDGLPVTPNQTGQRNVIPGMRPDGSVPAPGYGTNGQLLPNGQVLVNQNGQATMVQPQQVVQPNGQVVQMMPAGTSQGVLMSQPTLATPQTINAAGAQRQRVQW